MQFFTLALSTLLATAAVASPVKKWNEWENCLTDAQANYLVQSFKQILSDPNRTAIVAIAEEIIATDYVEISDSINSLAGYPLGSQTFVGKETYIGGETHAPAVPEFVDQLIFHDCTHITWYWIAYGIGTGAEEVKGINIFTTTNGGTQILTDNLEFNSIAWGIDDQQVTNTPPPPPPGAPSKRGRKGYNKDE